MNDVIFSSKTDNWSTPQFLFDSLNSVFNFNLDPCADKFNHKCDFYFDKDLDGLSQSWAGFRVFCNPPYGRTISKWVYKSYISSFLDNTVIVLLLPVRTDTKWFHDFIINDSYIYFIKGRLKFGDSKNNAPFPSMVVVYDRFHKFIK